jgi:hypothetical protein
MFEKASRMKLRFSYRGAISTEDLWDLGETDLNSIYTYINRDLKAVQDEGLMARKGKNVEVMELQLAIVKHVYETKVREAEQKMLEIEKSEKKRRIEEIIAKKQDSELEGKTVEELAAMRDAL